MLSLGCINQSLGEWRDRNRGTHKSWVSLNVLILAVIKIDGSGFSYLKWYDQTPQVGLEVYTAGFSTW